MLKEHQRIESKLIETQKKLINLPEGKLICSRNGNHYKWYRSFGSHKEYIPKKNLPLAEQLAAKKFLTEVSEYLSHEKKSLEFYLRHHDKNPKNIENFLINIPGYKELLIPFFTPQSQALSDWMNAPYERNPNYPEKLIHKTASGNFVRSKSEVMIDMLLYTKRIPFRYECPLQLGETTLFPDFTIRHPKTGDFFYWEHFGLMDDRNYAKHAFSKLDLYSSHGILPMVHLITTFENRKNPLSLETIENIIDHYFL